MIKTLEQIEQFIGTERLISVSREISKFYEETVRGTAPELLKHFSVKEPRGEFVMVIGPKIVAPKGE